MSCKNSKVRWDSPDFAEEYEEPVSQQEHIHEERERIEQRFFNENSACSLNEYTMSVHRSNIVRNTVMTVDNSLQIEELETHSKPI